MALSPDGEPRSFVWRRFEYEVIGQPQSFYQRRNWWRELGSDLLRIDKEFWRVEATCDGDHVASYDLLRLGDGDGWQLMLAWE
ncbi:DUF6504 family protein [Gryllotalpicola reticulitermitis]|uniref:DUF6504 family protein n=1 Tax=Gryllotalpicola reticulitermitis TaxID=1184153 RepID=A0ABV8Q9U3_9MICO